MTESNIWLIRTKQNKILGPITKQKIKDLIAKGSLTPEDEICSGNGYWFWIKEEELLDKYIHGDITQEFNPVCEAVTIVANCASHLELADKPNYNASHTQIIQNPPQVKIEEDDVIIPSNEDLEYPDMSAGSKAVRNAEEFKYEIPTFKQEKEIKEEKALGDVSEEIVVPDADDLEYPDMENVSPLKKPSETAPVSTTNIVDDEIDNLLAEELLVTKDTLAPAEDEVVSEAPIKEMPKPVRKKKRRKKAEPVKMKEMSKRNDKIVFYLIGLIISIVLYGVYYYYTSILGKDIISSVANNIIPAAHAQSIDLDQKKKSN